MPLSPAHHIHLATVDGDLVLLDAQRDDYLCIDRTQWTAPTPERRTPDFPDELADALVEEGLMVRSERPQWPETLARSARSDLRGSPPARIRPIDIILLLIASVRTLYWLRRQPPAAWFDHLLTHPLHHRGHAADTCVAARRFMRLRPLVPRSGRCLPKSLLLLHFLRRQGLAASWVFGVRTFPFEAHCWLEADGIVLDDTAEHVAWFTPIVRLS